MSYQRITGCLCANSHPGSYTSQDAYNDMLVIDKCRITDFSNSGSITKCREREREREYASALTAHDAKDNRDLVVESDNTMATQCRVRRLTPLECCRLQGFPDNWCEGVPGSQAAQYKMWGNGMTLPVILYVMAGIKEVNDREA